MLEYFKYRLYKLWWQFKFNNSNFSTRLLANGLLIQWGTELVDKDKRYNDITYYAYSRPPIVLLSATRSATRWESAGFVGAINITENGFRASYGEYKAATNIEKYTWIAIGY